MRPQSGLKEALIFDGLATVPADRFRHYNLSTARSCISRGFAALRDHDRGAAAINNTEQMQKYYGKFRGRVRNNIDPLARGRILADVPQILGTELSWCMPCAPYAQDVGDIAIPPVGANVWIEFERGDLDYPIWSGCFWG